MLHEIGALMDKNKYLRKLAQIIRESKVMEARRQRKKRKAYDKRVIKLANKLREEFKACYDDHKNEFDRLERMLEDDFSRLTLRTVIKYRLKPRRRFLKRIYVQPQYFPRDILRPVENEVFIDGGVHW